MSSSKTSADVTSAEASKSLVQRQFGANAANYATSKVHAKGASLARLVELVAPQPGWRALDVATGAGHTAAIFAPHVASVIASDLTDEMIAQAAKLAREKSLSNMSTAKADAEALPFPDASFELVTCRIAPHHFPDIPAFVAEVWRVLTPGGTFALVDNVSPDAQSTPGFPQVELRDAAAGYNAFEKLRDPSHGRAWTAAEWIALAEDVGFTIAHRELLPKAMEFAPWCKTMAVAPQTVTQLRSMLTEAKPALKAFLKPVAEGSDIGFTLLELVLIARKPGATA
jgi:ubiquinone/menaquinone biosynthesis C-methylase UbiE